MPAADGRVAVVTGANRGLGLETCRQLGRMRYRVVLAARNSARAQQAAQSLAEEGLEVTPCELDITDEEGVERLRGLLEQSFERLDVLVNNAGVFPDARGSGRPQESSVFNAPLDQVRGTFEVNALGPLRLAQALVPMMRRARYGRIVNVSSGMGQLCDMGGCFAGYRLSKTALNAVTRIVAAETAGDNILVNSVCPGWVRTAMGGANAERSVEEGAKGIVWAATLPDGGPSGGFFRDGQPLSW